VAKSVRLMEFVVKYSVRVMPECISVKFKISQGEK
jgi:hypothetical protein